MDRYVTSPMSVFTVEEPGYGAASCPPPERKRASCNFLIQLILLLFALLALCGVVLQIYYLSKVQANLDAAQEMVSVLTCELESVEGMVGRDHTWEAQRF